MEKSTNPSMIGIDEIEDVYQGRILTMKEMDRELGTRNPFRKIGDTIEKIKEKYVLIVVKEIMLKEMKKSYYENAGNVKEFIDIDTHFVTDEEGNESYHHIENLCIWHNGFYNFNGFNLTTSGLRLGNQKKIR